MGVEINILNSCCKCMFKKKKKETAAATMGTDRKYALFTMTNDGITSSQCVKK